MSIRYTHDCVRTIAFTCPCDKDGNTASVDILTSLLIRVADVARCEEWDEACDVDDITEGV